MSVPSEDYQLLEHLTLVGSSKAADVAQAIKTATVNRTIDGASTLDLELYDHRRTLLRSGAIDAQMWAVVDGLTYELVSPNKTDDGLTLQFEDGIVAALRRKTGTKTWEASSTTRTGIIADLAAEVPVPTELDPSLKRTVTKEVNRSKEGQEVTDSWSLSGSLATDVAARRFSTGRALVYGTDDWLTTRYPALRVTEPIPGPDGKITPNAQGIIKIDFSIDYGQKSSSATMVVDADRFATPPGQAVEMYDMGPADGRWLVTGAPRTLGRNRMTVSLARITKPLPEPEEDAGEFDFLPGYGAGQANGAGTAPFGGTSTATNPRAIEGSARQQLVAAAQRCNGKPYVWGGNGPVGYDCSGLVQMACQVAGKPLAKPVSAQWRRCVAEGRTCSVEVALKTPGALLFRVNAGEGDHVVISLGGDRTVEARGKAYGCGEFGGASKRTWTGGALWV